MPFIILLLLSFCIILINQRKKIDNIFLVNKKKPNNLSVKLRALQVWWDVRKSKFGSFLKNACEM